MRVSLKLNHIEYKFYIVFNRTAIFHRCARFKRKAVIGCLAVFFLVLKLGVTVQKITLYIALTMYIEEQCIGLCFVLGPTHFQHPRGKILVFKVHPILSFRKSWFYRCQYLLHAGTHVVYPKPQLHLLTCIKAERDGPIKWLLLYTNNDVDE